MWMGDLLQNTATLNSVNFNRNIQGRNALLRVPEGSGRELEVDENHRHGSHHR